MTLVMACLLGLYYGVTISLVSFATGLSVVTLNLHHRGMRGQRWGITPVYHKQIFHLRVPASLKYLVFEVLAKVLCIKLNKEKKRKPKTERPGGELEEPQTGCVFCLSSPAAPAGRSK